MSKTNAIKVKEFGLDVIYRHDYDGCKDEISQYVEKSCEYLKSFIQNIPEADDYETFLDIGCANTQAIDYFEKLGYEAKGIDLYPQKEDSRIVRGDFYELEKHQFFGDKKTDIIFINHTLEHCLSPLLLAQIRKIHRIGGAIFIAVPDADYEWAYDITSSTTHWTIFNQGFLRHLLTRYGYECVVKKKCFREEKGELFLVGIRRF